MEGIRLCAVGDAIVSKYPVAVAGTSSTLYGITLFRAKDGECVPFGVVGVDVLVCPEGSSLVDVPAVLYVGDLVSAGGHA